MLLLSKFLYINLLNSLFEYLFYTSSSLFLYPFIIHSAKFSGHDTVLVHISNAGDKNNNNNGFAISAFLLYWGFQPICGPRVSAHSTNILQ